MQFCNPGVACKVQIVSGPNFQSDCELHVLSEERSHTSVWHGGLKPTVGHFFFNWYQYRYLLSVKARCIGIGRLSVSVTENYRYQYR